MLPPGWILWFKIRTLVPCGFGKTDSSTADLCLMSQAEQLGSLRLTETQGGFMQRREEQPLSREPFFFPFDNTGVTT